MTLGELSQLKHLKREIALDRQRLRQLEEAALPGAQVMTGMPHSTGVKDRLGDTAAAIADLRQQLEAKIERCVREQQKLEAYIESIPDSFIRQIFIYRFVQGMSWRQVADQMGGGNSAGNIRVICHRFVRKKEQNL